MPARRARVAAVALSGALAAGLVGSCGGDDRESLDAVLGDGAAGDFTGTLEPEGPASREVELAAGEALRVWARPAPQDADGAADANEAGDDVGVSLALALSPDLFDAYADAGYFGEVGEEEFYSDYRSFFTDYFTEAERTVGPDEYGTLLVWTETGADAGGWRESDPPWFWCGARGWGGASAQGSWFTFVAPIEGTYSLLVGGFGAYEIHVETQAAPQEATAAAADDFDTGPQGGSAVPIRGAAWDAMIDAHGAFLSDPGGDFFPADQFFSDYEGRERPYGPDVAGC